MGIRPAKTIRDSDKPPFTRYSRSKPRKSYIKAMPHRDLNQYRMGNKKDDYDLKANLVAVDDVVVRDNALESARQSTNKHLETKTAGNYYFIVRPYPHHVIRENKMIAGAGADRLQKGMRKAYGRPTDRAARLYKGQEIFTVFTYKNHIEHVKAAFEKAKRKLSGKYRIEFVG
ncbi:50S ribosomal protein L16 [Candidatus Micrarchaeota archaeon]|nr:50S ribosomal protein L16 [Candidatus Micrarchaeota archaeon]